MILVDSSVWIAHLRNHRSSKVEMLQWLINSADDELLTGDLVLLEVLRGARDDRHAARIERIMRLYPCVTMLDPNLAVRGAAHYRTLRQRGITIRKTIDLIIGAFCIENGHTLLHDDRDFDPIVVYLGLKAA